MKPKILILFLFLLPSLGGVGGGVFSQPVQQEWIATYNGPDNLGFAVQAMAMDSLGNIIVTGYTNRSSGWQDYCTVKYNSSGVQQWVAIYEGTGNNNVSQPAAIGVDQMGNIYVTGWTGNISIADYCTIKYSPDGVQQWVARYNYQGGGDNEATSLAIDINGNCYITGSTYSPNYSATIKYSLNGDSLWVTKYYTLIPVSIAVDSQSNSYLTGASSQGMTTVKYNSSGVQQWVSIRNNSGGHSIILDNQNNIYVVGQQPPTYVTVKYNNSGVQQWAQIFTGSTSYARPYGIAVDKNNNVYITGYFYNGSSDYDYATIKYNLSGIQQWVQIYNGPESNDDEAYSLALDDSANVYITGRSIGNNGYDFCTIKYNSSGTQQWLMRYPGVGIAVILDRNINVYVAGRNSNGGILIKYSQISGLKPVSKDIPSNFKIYPNFPNPFNSSTNIIFDVPEKSVVQIKIYNSIGAEIGSLLNEVINPGRYKYNFNNNNLSSGIYFYRITASSNKNNFIKTMKMILLK